MAIFRKGPGSHAIAVAMCGVKMGERLLVLGCGDGRLCAELASKVGLTGRAVAIDERADAAERAGHAAQRAGVLVEINTAPYHMLPLESESFDVVVVNRLIATMIPNDRVGCLQEARRVLRPGARCLVIETAERGGLGALFGRHRFDPHYRASGGAAAALRAEGFVAVRLLAERDGIAYFEGAR